ncbi:hypothetical protein ROLI_037190 [Roseobacter fucihabitans]|uniref:SRPBCC family protein n=1 Tax=Roseobacter fucihabitans TaxID=1537242 RepID=A0ABZ2BZL4_9RHOB|nr:SRPBCC family protein [Roseobacter litoralis]MBC6966371.1 Polyketide cyclase / dehydrase and lipid transport [Roseobacter litoralis]
MKFSTQQEIDAPIAVVFAMLSEFDALEAALRRRGADVARMDDPVGPGAGLKWHVRVELAGGMRAVDVEIVAFDPPARMGAILVSQGVQGDTRLSLVALSAEKTRVLFEVDLRATTFAARVLLQPLKLGKTSLDQRFEARVAQYLDEMKQRYDQGEA